jgi:hypothetical protein
MALTSVQNFRHYSINGCERVIIFRDQTPSSSFSCRGCRRAQRFGGLRTPVASTPASVRDEVGFCLGHLPGRPRSLQADAPPSWPAAQDDRRRGQGLARPHRRRENSRGDRFLAEAATARARGAETKGQASPVTVEELRRAQPPLIVSTTFPVFCSVSTYLVASTTSFSG